MSFYLAIHLFIYLFALLTKISQKPITKKALAKITQDDRMPLRLDFTTESENIILLSFKDVGTSMKYQQPSSKLRDR